MQHAEFHISYIWVALATALGAGFAIGAYLALALVIAILDCLDLARLYKPTPRARVRRGWRWKVLRARCGRDVT